MHDRVKFQFDTSFDTGESERNERPKPAFSEAELAAARDQGFAAGHAAGIAEAATKAEAIVAGAAADIARQLADIGQTQAAALDQAARNAVSLATRVASKLAPAALKRFAAAEVEALLEQCLADLHDEPRIVLRASEQIVDALRARISEIAARSGFPGLVVLLPDDRLSGPDCRIEWADGGLERDSAALMGKIDFAIGRFLDGEPNATTAGDAPARSL